MEKAEGDLLRLFGLVLISFLPLDLEVVDGEGWFALDYGELAAIA
jgi:hypothetical protein